MCAIKIAKWSVLRQFSYISNARVMPFRLWTRAISFPYLFEEINPIYIGTLTGSDKETIRIVYNTVDALPRLSNYNRKWTNTFRFDFAPPFANNINFLW